MKKNTKTMAAGSVAVQVSETPISVIQGAMKEVEGNVVYDAAPTTQIEETVKPLVEKTKVVKSHKLTDEMKFRFDLSVVIKAQMPPQAQACYEAVKQNGKTELTGREIRNLLTESGLLKTKQDPYRIFQYYRTIFIAGDFLRLVS